MVSSDSAPTASACEPAFISSFVVNGDDADKNNVDANSTNIKILIFFFI